MGTSINQRSPSTAGWSAVATAYASDLVPLDRAVQEIWRAASNQPNGDLAGDLKDPIVAECLRIAIDSGSREEAVNRASREVALSGQASLAADIAQHAVAHSFRDPHDRTAGFTRALFAQAGDYLVSRDLPGFVGEGGRARNVSQSLGLKAEIRARIATRVEAVARPHELTGADRWRGYVDSVVRRLKGLE